MRNITLILLMMLLAGQLPASPDPVLSEVDRLLAGGQLSEALSLVSKSIGKHAADPPRQALYVKALGDFYRDRCGDMNRARMSYRRIAGSPLPADHPLKQSARDALAGIKALETENSRQNARLRILMATAARKRPPEAVKNDIAELEAIIRDNPGYYLLHEVYYTLGLNYRALEQHGNVYRSLEKAMEIKPGIVFYLAVKHRAQQAYGDYVRGTVTNVTRGALWVLLWIAMGVFYLSKPWKWLGVKHVVIFAVLALSWWLVFTLSHVLAGTAFESSHKNAAVQPADGGKDPEYHGSLPGSPGGEVADHLFWYGLLGVAGVWVLSTALGRFKYKKTAAALSGVYGFLLFLALSSLFYMTHCDRIAEFNPGGEGISRYLSGGLHFKESTPEPFILTDPLSYPGLHTKNISDPYLLDWILKHCPGAGKSGDQ